MSEVYLFNTQVRETNEGTKEILNYFKAKGYSFTNVENDKEYQKIDVDYICKNGNKESLLEIKVDSYKTGNIFYEYYSNFELKTQGCFEKTKADFILYYFSQLRTLYILNPIALREYVTYNKNTWTPKYIPNTTFHSMGFAIPIAEIKARDSALSKEKKHKKIIQGIHKI